MVKWIRDEHDVAKVTDGVRERATLEAAAADLVDMLAERGHSDFQEVKPAQRRAAALAEEWGAFIAKWDRGRMFVRLRRMAVDD